MNSEGAEAMDRSFNGGAPEGWTGSAEEVASARAAQGLPPFPVWTGRGPEDDDMQSATAAVRLAERRNLPVMVLLTRYENEIARLVETVRDQEKRIEHYQTSKCCQDLRVEKARNEELQRQVVELTERTRKAERHTLSANRVAEEACSKSAKRGTYLNVVDSAITGVFDGDKPKKILKRLKTVVDEWHLSEGH